MYARVCIAAVMALMTAVLAPAAAAQQPQPDGKLIRTPDGKLYRVVGGAPLPLASCAFANCADVVEVPNLSGYEQFPRDGALAYGGSDGGVYRFAGGAPLWIIRCTYGPGCAGLIQVDDNAFRVGDHIRQYPADSTVIRNVDDGGYYRFAGGAPLLVRCDIGPNCVNPPMFDGGTFWQLGSIIPGRKSMRSFPLDGTTVVDADDGGYYRFAGGAPLPIARCTTCPSVLVDSRTFTFAGTATPSQPHMLAAPVDGTYLKAGSQHYRVAGGAAVRLTTCAPLGGCAGAVTVEASTIASRGGGRLRAVPRDGTVLRGLPSRRLWEIVDGKRRETFISVAGLDVDDGALAAFQVEAPPAVAPTPAPPPAPTPIQIPTPVPRPEPEPAFAPIIASGYVTLSGRTRFTALTVRDLPPGSRVDVTCRGKGCPYKSKRYRPRRNGRVDLAQDFRRARLRSAAVLTVRATAPNGAVKLMRFTTRAGNKLPVRKRQCAPPGGKLKSC
jgi:hypothetical protein